MSPANRFAFKEWAVICAALGTGRQSLILRKGGIHEGRDGFRVEHPEFWLFPTNYHQTAEDLAESCHDLWDAVQRDVPPADVISLRYYTVVEQVSEINDEAVLSKLSGLHGWSDRVLHDRFHYKRPGLFALQVRVYELPVAVQLPNSLHFAGCRSWVDLPEELSTAGLRPVVSDADHEKLCDEMSTHLTTRDSVSSIRRMIGLR